MLQRAKLKTELNINLTITKYLNKPKDENVFVKNKAVIHLEYVYKCL